MSDPLGLHLVVLPDGLGILAEDWHQPSTSVQQQVLSLLKRGAALEARVHQDSYAQMVFLLVLYSGVI